MHLTNNTQNLANAFEMQMIIILSKKHFCLWKDCPEHLFSIVGPSDHVVTAFRAHLLNICFFCYNCTSICFCSSLSKHAQWSNITIEVGVWRGYNTWMLGLQPPHTKWPLTQWKICFGGAISSKHTWTQKWKIGKSLKILIYRTLRRLDPGSPLSHLEVPHGLLQNFTFWFFSNSLPLLGNFFCIENQVPSRRLTQLGLARWCQGSVTR